MEVKAFMDGKETIEGLKDRITGRVSCEEIKDRDGNVIVKTEPHDHSQPCGRESSALA